MPRTVVTKTAAPGAYPTAGVAVTWADADPTNKNAFVLTANELVLARNAHATDPKTVTINSAADTMGRSKDITAESLAAGVVKAYGPFTNKSGWAQASTSYLHFEGESTDIKFAVITL